MKTLFGRPTPFTKASFKVRLSYLSNNCYFNSRSTVPGISAKPERGRFHWEIRIRETVERGSSCGSLPERWTGRQGSRHLPSSRISRCSGKVWRTKIVLGAQRLVLRSKVTVFVLFIRTSQQNSSVSNNFHDTLKKPILMKCVNTNNFICTFQTYPGSFEDWVAQGGEVEKS